MIKKIKNFISIIDHFLYQKFGSYKTVKILENIKEAQIIFLSIMEIGEISEVRFVGGCVRKALKGEIIDDIDLATSFEPEEVKKKLTKKNIKVIDTGINHGTVTAIFKNKTFEITTLRKDISTDGRHANVEFTLDWDKDALRRDFTINAIYSDIEGRIFDPQNGIADLKNGKVKFIGNPEERIQEDYLRILRYFRFFTQYSKFGHENNTIKSIKKYINGLNKVSNERIFSELKKILTLKNLYNLFLDDKSKEIILNIFPQLNHYKRLKIINNLNQKIKKSYDIYLILALLIIDETNNYDYFCHKYKVSNSIKDRYKNISKNLENLKNKKFFTEKNIKKMIYLSSKENVKDLLLFSICESNKIKSQDILQLIEYVNLYKVPKFPISGDDLKKYGYKSGQKLGLTLKSLEEKWIENNFFLDKEEVKQYLNKNKYN